MSFNFNPADYTGDRQTFENKKKTYPPITPGWYLASIDGVSVKEWHDPKGLSLQLAWKIMSTEAKGRRYWQNMSVVHSDPRRELKARYMLADICNVTGVTDMEWDAENPPEFLVGKTCEIELVVMSPNPPRFPDRKNWLVSVRVPNSVVDAVAAEQEVISDHRATFDDDDVPF